MASQRPGLDVTGQAEDEPDRLDLHGAFLRPFIERLLWDAGIGPGMRVLDAGCGAGEVSLLLADLVGPSGEVVAVDRSEEVLATAERRIAARGLRQVQLVEGDIASIEFEDPFDAMVGRFILIHVPDPAGVLRHLAAALRSGAVVAFQEVVQPAGAFSAPPHPLFEQVRTWFGEGMIRAGLRSDMGLRLPAIFVDAGLPSPSLRLDGVVCYGADPGVAAWAAGALHALLPAIERGGIATADEVQIETLAARLLAEQRQIGGVVCPILLGGAFARTPLA